MIKKYSLLAVMVVVVLVPVDELCLAQMHRWMDDNGNVHLSNDVNTIPERHRPKIEVTESKRLEGDHTAESLPGSRTYTGDLEPEGFGDIKWGTEVPLEALETIGEDPSYGGIKICIKVGDELTIGSVTLKRVEYRFWRSRFCSARAITEGHSNFDILREVAFELFGEGSKPNPSIERYFWIGDRTNITLDYDELTGLGELLMSSVLMTREMEEMGQPKTVEEAKKHL